MGELRSLIHRRCLLPGPVTSATASSCTSTGAAYLTRLHQLLSGLGAGDWVYLTDWRIDATRRLAGPGSELGPLLVGLAGRSVAIRGLLWRFHPALVGFNQDANRVLSTLVNRAGGQLVADQWVRRFGSHHQKLLVVHRPDDPGRCIAFVGGIDLSRGRRDDPDHLGDDDPVRIDPRYGRRPPWHDLQLELHGPAVLDVDLTFRERWEDSTPPDHRNPLRAMWRRVSREPRRRELRMIIVVPRYPDRDGRVAVYDLENEQGTRSTSTPRPWSSTMCGRWWLGQPQPALLDP
jgi:phosphatidylserine/phosphatidylglycerophosphate/cardiolipin synthase-like enzyme